MTDLINQFAQAWGKYFGIAILQNSIFLTLIFILLYRLRNSGAWIKYIIAMTGIFKLLLPPFIPSSLLPAFSNIEVARSLHGTVSSDFGSIPFTAGSEFSGQAENGIGIIGLVFLLWMAGVISSIALSAFSTIRLREKLKKAKQFPDEYSMVYTGDRRTGICLSGEISCPLSLGIFPRKIFVPVQWNDWSIECRRLVILHEMAHIKRKDSVFQIFQLSAQAIYFFHPMVNILCSKLREYREMACDDISVGSKRSTSIEYSRYLVEIAEKMVSDQVACHSASALIRQKNELLSRVIYQMRGGMMRSMTRGKAAVITALSAIMILPFSWYFSSASIEQPGFQNAPAASRSENSAKDDLPAPDSEKGLRVTVDSDNSVWFEEKRVPIEELLEILKGRFKEAGEYPIIEIDCDADVVMNTIFSLHRLLSEADMTKVRYKVEGNGGVPLRLPDREVIRRMEEVPEQHIAPVVIASSGEVDFDGDQMGLDKLQAVLRDRLSKDPGLVVSLSSDSDTRYLVFINVLEKITGAGVKRVFVETPEVKD
ncbi:MAG: hypothetical protein JW814_11980 [Candidatus Krumholzibacteriota bacterium]|nr:hypothetical protein [Candidatus Krumholzibacteriota bacterium]